MGYRNYIGIVPKKDYNKLKSMTIKEVYDFKKMDKENDHIGVYDFGKKLYEFGKYVDFNPPKKSIKPFFKNKETQKHWDDEYDFNLVTKEFLAYIIDLYKERIKKYYNEMVIPFFGTTNSPSDFLNSIKTEYGCSEDKHTFDFSKITETEQTALFKIFEHIRSFRTEWVQLTPYNLESGEEITTSWKFEYGLFELVRIYKSFDWKRNVMIYYGY